MCKTNLVTLFVQNHLIIKDLEKVIEWILRSIIRGGLNLDYVRFGALVIFHDLCLVYLKNFFRIVIDVLQSKLPAVIKCMRLCFEKILVNVNDMGHV